MDNEKLNDGMLEQVDGGARIVYRWNRIEDPNVLPVGTKLTIKY